MRTLVRVVCVVLLVVACLPWLLPLVLDNFWLDAARDVAIDLGDPSRVDLVALSLGGPAVLGLLLSRKNATAAGSACLAALGIVLGVGGYFGGFYARYQGTQSHAGSSIPSGYKPGASETVLGYHWRTPEAGGPAAFGDGSVRSVSKEDFAKSRRADDPERKPVWTSPARTEPSANEPKPTAAAPDREESPDVRAARAKVREAELRMKISSDLKALAVLYHREYNTADAPRAPEELFARGGDARLRAAVEDGTYVWYFGWEPSEWRAKQRELAGWKASERAGRYAIWLGGALLTAGVVGYVAARRAGRAVVVAPARPG